MSKKKLIHKQEEVAAKNNIYCAECGDELDMFGIDGSVDHEKIKERHKRCKENGKFKGDMCSMLFIASDVEPQSLSDEAD